MTREQMKRFIDGNIRASLRDARYFRKMLRDFGIPGILALSFILGRRIGRYMADKPFINGVISGKIREDVFVRNIGKLLVDDIDVEIKKGKIQSGVGNGASDELKKKILQAHTIKELLAIVPNNKTLKEADRLFTQARMQGNLA